MGPWKTSGELLFTVIALKEWAQIVEYLWQPKTEPMIKIHGPIGSYKNEKGDIVTGIELVDVIAQVEAETGDTYLFDINSIGGLVSVGYAIRDYMEDLKKDGKTVNTIGNGVVASIATVVFLAGTERELVKGTKFVVHNPYAAVEGDADLLKQYAKGLEEAEADMAKFYSKVTGVSAIAMDLLMKEDKPMSTERAVQLKFATKEVEGTLNEEFKNMQIIAAIKLPEGMDNPKSGTDILKKLTALYNKLSGKIKSLSVTTDDGKGLEVEGETLAVGALVTLDGEPTPAATYKLVDGTEFKTDSEGKITEITEAEVVAAKMGDEVKDEKGELIKNGKSVLADGTKVKTDDAGKIIAMEAGEPAAADSKLEKENTELKARLEVMEKKTLETNVMVEKFAKLMGSDFTPEKRATIFGKRTDKDQPEGSGSGSSDDIRANRKARKKAAADKAE